MSKKILTPDELLKTSDEILQEETSARDRDIPANAGSPQEKPRKFRDPYNYKTYPTRGEANYSPSLTIPNDSFSLQELLDRNQRGLPLTTSGRTELYHGEEEMPDLQRMDISEIHDLAQANQNHIKSYRDLQQREAEAAVLAKERKLLALEKEVAAFRQKFPATTSTDDKKPLA